MKPKDVHKQTKMADADGQIIQSSLLYTIMRYARFLVDFGMVYLIESPIFSQQDSTGNVRYFYPSDPCHPGTEYPVDLNMKKEFRRYKGLGSLNSNEVYDAFYDPTKRRLIQVTPEGAEYAAGLVEDITNRKSLLRTNGILSDPYGLG